jgi:hypothetical protein
VIAIARLTSADIAADSGVLRAMILVRSSFATRYFPPTSGSFSRFPDDKFKASMGFELSIPDFGESGSRFASVDIIG